MMYVPDFDYIFRSTSSTGHSVTSKSPTCAEALGMHQVGQLGVQGLQETDAHAREKQGSMQIYMQKKQVLPGHTWG